MKKSNNVVSGLKLSKIRQFQFGFSQFDLKNEGTGLDLVSVFNLHSRLVPVWFHVFLS